MTHNQDFSRLSRRRFLQVAGGLASAGALTALLPRASRNALFPSGIASAADRPPDLYFAGTDGWIYLPPTPAIPPYHPDVLAPAGLTTYIFGFRNITGLSPTQIAGQKMKAQHSAPLFWVDEGTEFHLKLTNLGLAMRPDLVDSHTVHWHGFRDAIPFFDGEPHGSVSVPIGKNLTYVYRPHDPGTYMYHCHVEDVEHVHMGMAGIVFVRPAMGPKFAYNDATTGFDREFALFLSEVWAEAHWADAHIQLPEWSDYHVDFPLLNGRAYPDTLAPNGGWVDYYPNGTDLAGDGDLIAPAGRPELQYQPLSSLIRCNAGENVLLRWANLGYQGAAMTLAGIKMRVVGMDATPMRGRDGTDTSFVTNTLTLYSGAAADAIFTAPAFVGPGTYDPDAGASYDRYMLYNRAYRHSNNLDASGYGGQTTEVRVYPAGTLPPQTLPNT